MKTRLIVAVAMFTALVGVGVIGCSSKGHAADKTIEVSMDDVLNQRSINRDVTLSVGDTLKVSLGSNHSTPYRWTADPKIGDPAILKQYSHEYQHEHTDRVGSPGNEVWTFNVLKTGTTTISADYASIVGSDPTPTCTFTANVTVK
ncbi:protease inhibitor I42 family protein [Mycobacterium angelicum]|uniref:Proteinase inhibitor I42 chagasin domain-containing protein n=1 Tax=Mycobacterium angelicum TaxID=470074 RepID=A0A1W9ZD39_MYCAN|nr:protease inhibitor I42 family protein [Mycobacterium angelicum]MCV7199831.1 protease inhibitor I42 family protein [Mycobacterium angelicum]ORA12432.1 hypothetical protein BST12_24970 [Mycobacterium angelicum]